MRTPLPEPSGVRSPIQPSVLILAEVSKNDKNNADGFQKNADQSESHICHSNDPVLSAGARMQYTTKIPTIQQGTEEKTTRIF